MSCTALTRGRSIDCRNSAGGIKAIYIAPFDAITAVVIDGQVTDLDLSPVDLFKYNLKRGLGNVSESINGSTENGSIYYTPTVNIKLHKLTKEDQNELKLLASARVVIFAELNQVNTSGKNTIVMLGRDNGLELNSGTVSSGVAMGDMSGYDMNFDGMEANPMALVADYSSEPFDNTDFTVTVS
jgi:hypothetical protein|tara:strand:- start:782 stop:1333 length:552 start_codon:yes stop_codon:yes gene_type:complete